MSALERISRILAADGYPVNLAESETSYGPLIVSLGSESHGGEMTLLIDQVGTGVEGDTQVLVFSLVFPYYLLSTDALPELIRSIFIFSRLLPVGSYSYCEHSSAVSFKYQYLSTDVNSIDEQVIRDAVGMIGMYTQDHARYFDLLMDEKISTAEIIEELAEQGQVLEPILGPSFAAA